MITTACVDDAYRTRAHCILSHRPVRLPSAHRFKALDHAKKLLVPDGLLGVVDFYVARKHPATGRAAHSWLQRNFWPTWFANDNVHLSADHVPYLHNAFGKELCKELLADVPYIGMLMPKVPYYIFIGKIAAS